MRQKRRQKNFEKSIDEAEAIGYKVAPLLEKTRNWLLGSVEKKLKKSLTGKGDLDRVLACRFAPAGQKSWSLKTK